MRTTLIAVIVVGLMVLGAMIARTCEPLADCPAGVCGMENPTVLSDPEVRPTPEKTAEEAVITTPVLERLIRSGAKVTILDARSGKFDDGMRIPGAKSLSPEAAREAVQKVVASRDDLVVTYCSNLKCPASHKLAAHLRELGYKNVLEYAAGMTK